MSIHLPLNIQRSSLQAHWLVSIIGACDMSWHETVPAYKHDCMYAVDCGLTCLPPSQRQFSLRAFSAILIIQRIVRTQIAENNDSYVHINT